MGEQFANDGYLVLALLAVAFVLLAANVVPHYALLAFGRVRFISGLNIGSGILLIALMAILIPPLHLVGAALGRIAYSLILAVPYLVMSRKAFQTPALVPVEIL